MDRKTIVNVIDQDKARAMSLVSELNALGDIEAVMSSPGQWTAAGARCGQATAAFVGISPDADSTDSLIDRIHTDRPGLPVVVFGFEGSWERRSASGELRVMDALETPISPAKLKDVIARIRKRGSGKTRANSLRANNLFRSLVGKSSAIRQIQRLIDHVAITDSTVLITGESGTGKEVVARNVHYRSNRRHGPFVPINCAAIPDDLFESELFGHEKGAFTGAISQRKGRFELADTGTLFLDEIGDMPLATQTKMLRVIQERVFERVGSNRSIETNVRIIAATHCDLEKRIDEKRFRKDLFYRLNVFPIEMPSLRQRSEDIPLLVDELRRRLKHDLDLDVDFARDAMGCLASNRWDGNVRELANAIERIAILFPGGTVNATDLPRDLRSQAAIETSPGSGEVHEVSRQRLNLFLPPDGLDLKSELGEIEQTFIDLALKACDGVVAQAAELLNMRRTTLVEKIRRYSIGSNVTENMDPTNVQH